MEIAPLTQQEVFDKVTTHLLAQMVQALNDEDDCLYRDSKGNSCAIGCLLGELYSPAMEHSNVVTVLKKYPQIATLLGGKMTAEGFYNYDLLNELQMIHDGYDPSLWGTLLKKVANGYGLTFPTIQECPVD